MIHQAFRDYPGAKLDEHWFLYDPPTLRRAKQFAPHQAAKSLPAKSIPSTVSREAVRFLTIRMDHPERYKLPPWISTLPHLAYLQLPTSFVKTLQVGDLPASLEVLELDGEGKAAFDERIRLPTLRWFLGGGIVVKFREASFPSLYYLTLQLDKHRLMLPEVVAARNLRGLGISNVDSCEVFGELAGSSIEFLGLAGGKIDSLRGIEKLQDLTNLTLVGLKHVSDLTPLLRLPMLREVELFACTRIQNPTIFAQMPQLRKLHIKDCGNLPLNELRLALQQPLDELVLY